jgi:hypothetical protein
MAIPKSIPMRFTPKGLADAFDSTDTFPGSCQLLQNLVFDQSNPERVVLRPGTSKITNFTGFNTPGFISVQRTINNRVYGMIASARNANKDEPFCYDLVNNVFITISNVTNANTPTSPVTNGNDWTPPTLDIYGTMIVIAHPGFSGAPGIFFGVIDITNPAAPTWNARNTVTTLLPSVPVACANFNNRMWFACGNQVWFTDDLTNPPTITNATQFITVGDVSIINALVGLPVQTSSAGIVQTLYIFKAATQIWQIAGDIATANLSQNYVSLTVGTNSPRSIAQSPLGIYFTSVGGPYFINPIGALLPVTSNLQEQVPDVLVPFQNAIFPTRWAGAYNATTYRVCGQTNVNGISGTNDYWFDEHRRRWNGPHTFSYDCASAWNSNFVLSSYLFPGALFLSTPVNTINSSTADAGSPIVCHLVSATFPKVDWIAMKQVSESQIELSSGYANVTYTVTAEDEQGNILNQANVIALSNVALWGSIAQGGSGLLWGSLAQGGSGAVWGQGQQNIPHTYPVPWTAPFVFEKMQLDVTVPAGSNVGIGTFYARYMRLGYVTLG